MFFDTFEDYLDNLIYGENFYGFAKQFEKFNNTLENTMKDLTKEMRALFREGVEELVEKINKNTIDNVVVRKKPYDISGDIIYENDKLYILGNDGVYYLQNTSFEPVDDKYIGINENSERLKNILKNTFKNENISIEYGWENIGVTNLTWFIR